MLFWIVLGLIIISAIGITVTHSWIDVDSSIGMLSCFAFCVSALLMIVMCVILICNYSGIDGAIKAYEKRYESLVYQYENDVYDNDLGKRELMEDIEAWNCELATKQENQDDFWLGILTPNVYNDFEFIEYSNIYKE